ncbi:MAG: acyl-ACP--UDP-N-acetylglucosamine O-acyltransferase [Proteobacteria bacterium]|nr:acyl-ACP--UDP-N-acetylglucosamine O-acyltransferase [Pseudomonadota bacterium]MBI3496890.1 acyl-ACP--UDP-N-acetylglucosamine O-acyltransferase [Pseudomonadota bacterium]
MTSVHPTAIVEPGARFGERVVVGPFCCVGAAVDLGDGVELSSHVVIGGRTRVGAGTKIFPFASIGLAPQDLKYHGEPSELIIGRDNVIREHVTMHPGTEGGAMKTVVGDGCLFMVNTHIAHDCVIGNRVVMANNATLGGHVHVEDYVILGGVSAVHQRVRIGKHAIVGGMSGVEQDVIPYGLVMGDRARLSGLNLVGLKRRGFGREDIQALRTAYRLLFAAEGTLAERLSDVAELYKATSVVMDIINFIRADATRPICQPKGGNAG